MKHKVMWVLLLCVVGYVVIGQFTNVRPEAVELNQVTPSFMLQTLEQEQWTEAQLSDNGTILNFWASYCAPCVKEMPLLQTAYEQGVDIWGVNTGESVFRIDAFLKNMSTTFPILRDADKVATTKFEVMALPTTYFIDGNGVVRKKVTGELTEQQLREGILLIQKGAM